MEISSDAAKTRRESALPLEEIETIQKKVLYKKPSMDIVDNEPGISHLLAAANNLARVGPLQADMFPQASETGEQILSLKISKLPNEGLGFSIIDGIDNCGVYVSYILDETSAKLNGLMQNDQILEINGEDVREADRILAVIIFKSLPAGPVSLKVRRVPNLIMSESLLFYLAKHSGFNTGSAGMYEYLYGEKLGVYGKHQKSQRKKDPAQKTTDQNGVAKVEAEKKVKIKESVKKDTVKHPTRLASCQYIIIFIAEAIAGLAVVVLECVTGGIYHGVIGGAEYAGIYVGCFAFVTGILGLVTAIIKVPTQHELKLHLVNMIMNIICIIQTAILFSATAALLARHVNEKKEWAAQTNSTLHDATVKTRQGEIKNFEPLLALKSTTLCLYFVILLAGALYFLFLCMSTRRRTNAQSFKFRLP